MRGILAARLASAAFVLVGVVTVVFLFLHLLPGDPVEVMLGESANSTDREALHQALGLDQPLSTQWLTYVTQLLHLDFGISLYSGQPVAEILKQRIPATMLLAATSLVVAVVLAVPLGVLAAVYKDSWFDRGAMVFAMLGISIPNFWLGPALIIVFSIHLGWTPVTGSSGMLALVLPAVTLGTALAALLSRMIRASLLDTLDEDYVRTARAKGLSEPLVILRHALGNAWLPVVTVLGLQLGGLLSGAVITETVFAWPGIGELTVEAIRRRDYPTVQACVLVISLFYVTINIVTDVLYAWLDPRIAEG